MGAIADLRAENGMTVLVTTHYMDEAEEYCDRVALMHRGRICAPGLAERAEGGTSGADATLDDVFRHHAGDCPATTREGCAMSVAPAAPPAASADAAHRRRAARLAPDARGASLGALCLVELQRLRHDRSELYTRAIQPALWLMIFGETFTRLQAIPTGGLPYLDFLAPGILAQSALFISIFYGIQIIWERDAGILAKLLVTPTPRVALIAGKAFAAGVAGAQPGRRRARALRAARRGSDDEPVADRRRRSGGLARRRRSSRACRCRSPASCSSANG